MFLGNGNGTFQTTAVSIAVTSSASLGQLVTGMFDANPRPDVAVLDNAGNIWILLNNSSAGAVSFASPASYALTSPGWAIAAADFGNGHVDLAVTQGQSSSVSILLGNGTGTFTPQADFDLGSSIPRGLRLHS